MSQSSVLNDKPLNPPFKNFSFLALFTCLTTLIMAFYFKDNLINILAYLETKSTTNLIEFHIILILLYIFVSLPILWGYMICVIICSYVYAFFYGFLLVVSYSSIGMTSSFFICRYMFNDYAHTSVQKLVYLQAIFSLIQSNEKGFKIIFLSRLMPIPFGLANAVFAVTNVKFRKYIIASIVGLIPSQIILCYMGTTLKSMSDVLVNENTAKTAWLVFIVQLIIAFGVMYYILAAARIELQKHINSQTNMNSSLSLNNENSINNNKCNCNCMGDGTNTDCENCKLLSVKVGSD